MKGREKPLPGSILYVSKCRFSFPHFQCLYLTFNTGLKQDSTQITQSAQEQYSFSIWSKWIRAKQTSIIYTAHVADQYFGTNPEVRKAILLSSQKESPNDTGFVLHRTITLRWSLTTVHLGINTIARSLISLSEPSSITMSQDNFLLQKRWAFVIPQ